MLYVSDVFHSVYPERNATFSRLKVTSKDDGNYK